MNHVIIQRRNSCVPSVLNYFKQVIFITYLVATKPIASYQGVLTSHHP